MVDKLTGWSESFVLILPNLIIAIVVLFVFYWLSQYLQKWLDKGLKSMFKQPSIRNLVVKFIAILILFLGLLLALAVMNLDGTLKSLFAGAGIAGLAISLALQGTLANTFSGIFIAVKDEVKVGDWIETLDYAGKVVAVDLRTTKVKESDNNIVVIPNKMLIENPFKNYGLTTRIRCNITCGVGYESDLDKVRSLAVEAIETKYPTKKEEQVEFYFTDFGDSSIDFLMRFWVDGQESVTALQVKSEAIMAIKKQFDKNGINIPFPIRTIIQKN